MKKDHGWKHDDLAHDLASHLRGGDRVVWEDMQLGPSGSPRPDVYTVPKSYSNFRPLAYEVKISVADFRRDVTAGKWQSYLRYAAGVIFAVPAGLIDKADVPKGCGLIVRSDNVWRTVKGPTLSRVKNLPLEAWQKLFIDGLNRRDAEPKPRRAEVWVHSDAARRTLGDDIAKVMADVAGARRLLDYQLDKLREQQRSAEAERSELVQKIREGAEAEARQVDQVRRELAESLGLSPDAGLWQLRNAAAEAAHSLNADDRIAVLQRGLDTVRLALAQCEPKPAATALASAVPRKAA